ncbi:B3 domain-containing transcription factor VRN1 [Euphorbia peplus]|nr:B3 domain-containing transcription factor VRN1 [Euphorbia peplus]
MASERSAPAMAEGPFRLFFKIILQGNNLRLPPRFVNQYGHELGNVAQLTVSDGRVWKMKVRREGNHIWLENGFPEFVKYYSIGYRHLLTFEYRSFSNFNVNVCDKSGCEIEYPPREEIEQEVVIVEESEEESDASLQILGSSSGQRNPPKYRKETPSSDQECKRKGKRNMNTSFLNRGAALKGIKTQPKIGVVRKHQKIITGKKFKTILSNSSEKTKTLVEFAKNIKLRNPSFLVIINMSNIRNDVLSVPTVFADQYMRGYSNIVIQSSNGNDGKKWMIEKFSWREPTLRLEKGLREFYRDNSLGEGDVCLFELVWTPNDVVLKASMFHTYAQLNLFD